MTVRSIVPKKQRQFVLFAAELRAKPQERSMRSAVGIDPIARQPLQRHFHSACDNFEKTVCHGIYVYTAGAFTSYSLRLTSTCDLGVVLRA